MRESHVENRLGTLARYLVGKSPADKKRCRHAGYGFKWFRGKRVVDEREQETMAMIFGLRESGLSWYEIARRLLYARVLTSEGQEWSPSRVRRAFLAYFDRTTDPT